MPLVHRKGDKNVVPAPILSTSSNTDVYAEGALLSIDGSPVQPHGVALHGACLTANGSSTVFCHGTPVNRVGDADNCGHTRGSYSVYLSQNTVYAGG